MHTCVYSFKYCCIYNCMHILSYIFVYIVVCNSTICLKKVMVDTCFIKTTFLVVITSNNPRYHP